VTPERVHAWLHALGGRRFLLCLGCSAVTTALLVAGYVDQGTWMAVILGTVGAYITGNVAQRALSGPPASGVPHA
jgi:uncharacterized membrane protein YeaQ/YmgE (transglycosylase-associated protein family)